MVNYIKKVRLKLNYWYVKHLFKVEKGFNVQFSDWNETGTECTGIFTCSFGVHFPDTRLNKTKEDLERYVNDKFGNNIIKESVSIPKEKFDLSQKVAGNIVETNEALNLLPNSSDKTAYKEDYNLVLTKQDLENINRDMRRYKKARHTTVKPFKIIRNSSYEKDKVMLKMGKWN